MTFRSALPGVLALALFLAPSALAQDRLADAPERVTYSGLLTDAEGAPLADGARQLVFRAYASAEAAASGAAPAWEEAHAAAVVGGRFLVVLGSRTALPDDAAWLTVAVDGEAASAPVRLDGATEAAALAPGNTLQDSYDNGRVVNVPDGAPLVIRSAVPGVSTNGFFLRDVTPVIQAEQIARFRLLSFSANRTWEYRVYGSANSDPGPGTFAITNTTGGGLDAFSILPSAGEDVLRLVNQTASVGSPDSPSDLALYTTENPLDPAGGRVNAEIRNHENSGGALELYEEDGTRHAYIEPDFDGQGGYLDVRAAIGSAFRVDGTAGSGSVITMAGGASPSVFDTGQTGNSAVQLPSNAIQDTEILDEAGVANNADGSPVSTPTGSTVTISRSITAPTSGFVLAIGTGELVLTHTSGSASTLQYSVSADCDATPTAPLTQQTNYGLPTGAATGTYRIPATVQGIFSVAAGTTTFCNYVNVTSGSASIDDQNISLVFLPTAYGSIVTNLRAGGDEVEEAPRAGLTAADVASERDASVTADRDRVEAELREMQERMAEIQSLLEQGNGD